MCDCDCHGPNIRPSDLQTFMPETRHVEILAYDDAETRLMVMKDEAGKERWTITNKRGLYLHYDNIVRAIGDLYAMTGIHDVGFIVHLWR